MEYSLPAWLGGLVGTVLAVAVYVPAIRVIEQHLRAQHIVQTAAEREAFDERLSIMRRVILGLDIAICATLGYWIGNALGGGMRG
jgi:hypothetical protein